MRQVATVVARTVPSITTATIREMELETREPTVMVIHHHFIGIITTTTSSIKMGRVLINHRITIKVVALVAVELQK